MSHRQDTLVSERIREARILRGSLHLVRDLEMIEAITAAIVRVCEGGALEGLDLALLPAAERVPPHTLGALKKAAAGVLARVGVRRDGGETRELSRAPARSPRRTPTQAGPGLFVEEPAPEPRVEPPSGELVFVDTETTGLKAGAHQVIEIGAMTSDGAEFVACISLWPGALVDAGAMAVNGIDLRGRQWRTEAVPLDEALRSFVRWLPTGAVLVAHNAAFDRRMLEADAARVGVEWPSVEWFCTKVWADDLRKRGVLTIENSKLHTLCERFGVPNAGEHRALADVVRMARVFEAMAEIEETRRAA